MSIELAIALLQKTVDLMEEGFCFIDNPFGLYDGEAFLDCDQLYYEQLIDNACIYDSELGNIDESIKEKALKKLMSSYDHSKLISQAASVVRAYISKQRSVWAE